MEDNVWCETDHYKTFVTTSTQVVQVHDLEKGNEKDAERSKEKAERVPFPECAGVEKVNNGDCEPESSRDAKEVTSSLTLSHFYKRLN